jgi:hypothetical protein
MIFRFGQWFFIVLGPGILVSAIARHDSLGVYAAGVVVTLIGWSQLVRWLQRHREHFVCGPKTHPAAQDADATVLGADELSQHANTRELRLMDKSQFEFSTSSKG